MKKIKLSKLMSLLLISSTILSNTSSVAAVGGVGDDGTTQREEQPSDSATSTTTTSSSPEPQHALQPSIISATSSVAVTTLSILGFPKLALCAGGVVAISEIHREGSQIQETVFRPLINHVKQLYASGQNPFKDPDQIDQGIERICLNYHLSEQNQTILRNFASPIILQLRNALVFGNGYLPADFRFAPNTVRCLYLIGQPGSGKSSIARDELPKVFLKESNSAIKIEPGRIQSSQEAVQVLFTPPSCYSEQYNRTAIAIKRPITLTEQVACCAGRGIVVWDDYVKYRSNPLDLCIFNLHDHGKIISPVGEIDCPALLMFFTSNESRSEFDSIEREVTCEAKAQDLTDVKGRPLTATSDIIAKTIGHPEGFSRRVRLMEMKRLDGDQLKEALAKHFQKVIVPNASCGHHLTISNEALELLRKINETDDQGKSCTFDFSQIETILNDFFHQHPHIQRETHLEITAEEDTFKISTPEELTSEDFVEDLDLEEELQPLPRDCWVSGLSTRYGFGKKFHNFGKKLKSLFCCCTGDPEQVERQESLPSAMLEKKKISPEQKDDSEMQAITTKSEATERPPVAKATKQPREEYQRVDCKQVEQEKTKPKDTLFGVDAES